MYLLDGDFQRSLPLFENLVKLNLTRNNYLQMLALNYYALGNYSQAKLNYELALKNNSDNVDLLNLVGLTSERLGQHESGKNFLSQAVASGGKKEDLLVERARVECISRRLDIALNYIAEANLLNPGVLAKIDRDDDFSSLRRDARFINLIIKNSSIQNHTLR
jgi:tetratricopeptide (TPR) repeat protein